ncbi:MAG TPA: transferrin-binding protein-like solute binding protein, partial [Rhizomicrobium sp.]|nr:transferrin-binding protein-like solute binding protein [Rhizomicrobium sp.]
SVANFSISSIQATYRGTVTSGGLTWPVFDLSIPALSLTATNVHGDGTDVTLPDGGKINAKFGSMTYTLLGAWAYVPASGSTAYLGHLVTGYATPTASVPTSGTANYAGTGTVIGAYFVPSGTSAIQSGTLSGDASLNVNFSNNTANGSFTNMQATALGSTTATPWNDISLNGSLSKTTGPGAAAFVDGSTTTTGNAGAAGFSSTAQGLFHGALYGPAAQEVGGVWNLSETGGGGKAAFGTFGAKQ